MATFEKYFRMDIMLYELVQEKFEKQIDAFGRERMEREMEKLKELQKKCEVDKSLCSRKRHVKYSDDPGKEKLSKEVNQVPSDAVRGTVPMDRDKGKVWFYIFFRQFWANRLDFELFLPSFLKIKICFGQFVRFVGKKPKI